MNTYIGGVQVAKEGSLFFYEEMSLYLVDNQYYVVNHNLNGLPSFKNIAEKKEGDWKVHPISLMEAHIIQEALVFLRKNAGKNLGAYSTVYTYCKMEGLDLIERGLLSVGEDF